MERLLEVYKFVVHHYEINQVPPTVREIRDGLHFSTESLVSFYLDRLIDLGVLEKASHGSSRCIRVVGGKWTLSPAKVVESWRIIGASHTNG